LSSTGNYNCRITNNVARGDIIAFKSPEDQSKPSMKRVIGLSGEKVEIKNGKILINGKQINMPSIANIYYYNKEDYAKEGKLVKVSEGFLYVLGDNSTRSKDSRYFGCISKESIIGKCIFIYLPPRRFGKIEDNQK